MFSVAHGTNAIARCVRVKVEAATAAARYDRRSWKKRAKTTKDDHWNESGSTTISSTVAAATRMKNDRADSDNENRSGRMMTRVNGGKLVGETWVTTSDAEDRIEEGLRQFKEKKFEQAVQSFERALTSEGNGTKRDRAKSKELTTAEKQSAYYNLAACHAKMENYDLAFASLELTFENGYANARTYGVARASKDFEALLNDVDLIPLKNVDERWNAITQKYRVKGSELAYQLDVSNSTIGRAIEMINKKK